MPHPAAVFVISGDLGTPDSLASCAARRVGECFLLPCLERTHAGTDGWSPLGGVFRPGETMLRKLNWVMERQPRDPEGWRSILTCTEVVRAVSGRGSDPGEGRKTLSANF